MRDEDVIWDLVFFALILTGFGLLICLQTVSAWPYALNLTSNGTIMITDLNASNTNETTNFTIYVVVQNISYNNYTNLTSITYLNITQQNLTCFNCTLNYTYYNSSYSNFTLNSSYFYNKTEADNQFAKQTELQTYKTTADDKFGLRSNLDSLTSTVNSINITALNEDKSGSHTVLWIVLVIIGLISLVALFMIMGGGG